MKDPIIHNKLDTLQFSSSVETGRFLIIPLDHMGYGAQVSRRLVGMKLAYIFDRTVLFDDSKSIYANCYENTSVFSLEDIRHLPVAKMRFTEDQEDQVVYFEPDDYWLDLKRRHYFETWVPAEIKKDHKGKEYFLGQLFLRLQSLPKYQKYVEDAKMRINFSNPIIGMHIRRGDKNTESPYVPIRIYNHYLKKAVKKTGIKKVFVTSDCEDIFSELPQHLGLEYIYDRDEKRYNNANHQLVVDNPELKEQETLTAMKIIELLSECDHIIGQVNTHFTNLAACLNIARGGSVSNISFVNRDHNDIYLNNDPNPFYFTLDLLKKYGHRVLLMGIRAVNPMKFMNRKIYNKLKSIYYGRSI